jgi:hypothetical protein
VNRLTNHAREGVKAVALVGRREDGRKVTLNLSCSLCKRPMVEVQRDCRRGGTPHVHAKCLTPSCRALMPEIWSACLLDVLPDN